MGMGKRRIVADVLLMSAFKLGNPIQIFIQTKVNDFAHRPGAGFVVGPKAILLTGPYVRKCKVS